MASSLESDVTDATLKYCEILKQNGITDRVSEIMVKDPGLVGEGMVSQSHYITVKFENSKLAPLNLFAKALTNNSTQNEFIAEIRAFEKEARFFTEYIPVANKLCKSKGQDHLMDIYPKCYYGDEKLIVLENLVLDKGYILLDKEEMQGYEEAKTALVTLAKHHAISYAVIGEYGGPAKYLQAFKDFDYDPYKLPSVRKMMEPIFLNSVNNTIKMLEKYDITGRDAAISRLKSDGDISYDLVLKSLAYENADKFLVLNHGDYWNNNMMFLKDTESQKILNHKAFDFQILRFNSPAVDLGYFLFTSVKADIRRAHLHELLTVYLTNFKKVATDLGHAIEFTFEELLTEFRKKLEFGYWLGFSMFTGAGNAIRKDIGVGESGDMSELHVRVERAIQKWISENPDLCEKVSKDTVELIEEYYKLRLE